MNYIFLNRGNVDKPVGWTPTVVLFTFLYFLLPCNIKPSSGSQVGIWRGCLKSDGWGKALSDIYLWIGN